MSWMLRSTIVLTSLAAVALLVGSEQNEALGQGKGKGKGDPVAAYQKSLETAMHKLKEAEKAILQADIRELNLAQFSPAHFQRMTAAIQHVNHAYQLCSECKSQPPAAPMKTPPKGKGKGKGKG